MRGAVGEFQVVAYCVERLPMIGKMFNSQVFKGNTMCQKLAFVPYRESGLLESTRLRSVISKAPVLFADEPAYNVVFGNWHVYRLQSLK